MTHTGLLSLKKDKDAQSVLKPVTLSMLCKYRPRLFL